MAQTENTGEDTHVEFVAPATNRKLKLAIGIGAGLAVIALGVTVWFFISKNRAEEVRQEAMNMPKAAVFVEVPDMMINLASGPGEHAQIVRIKVMLEVKEERQAMAIKSTMPRVVDIFQTYLRELRPSDLQGSAGAFRLKEELTRRVNVAVAPVPVAAVLFKEIVVQ